MTEHYATVDLEILSQIVTRDLPDLISALEEILSSQKPYIS